jgi:hypothetical protein
MNAFHSGCALAILMLSALAPLALPNDAQADPVVQNEEHCVVNVRANDVLNMRERPKANAPIAARKRHDECGITDVCQGSWCPVEDGHSLGWVHRHYIAMVSARQVLCRWSCSGRPTESTRLSLTPVPAVNASCTASMQYRIPPVRCRQLAEDPSQRLAGLGQSPLR